MAYKLWDIDEEGNLVFDVQEVKLIPEFKALWVLRYNVKKDSEGKNKLWNEEVFKYIWFMEDFRSPYIGEPEIERKWNALSKTKIPEWLRRDGKKEEDWKEDKEIINARRAYNEYYVCSDDVRIIKGLKQGLYSSSMIIDFCNENIQLVMQAKKDGSRPEIKDLELAVRAMTDLINMAKSIPAAIDDIEDYERKTIQKIKKVMFSKGKKIIGNRALPRRDQG